ncbi:MAG: response regulator [Deltaproteobacteria bacterium HGW-Deltaproteobacteria-15]|jgi:CheY-like chemotaxis protein|nr:MAG: response regulator [Deltaproteobacteria bacterium HGW-Deltaproteobacteria-15]
MAGKIKVLMVDDEEQFRSTTSKILTRKGYETTMAASGEEAIEALKKSKQDVVILDMKMPGMDGNQTLAELRKIDPDLPVIMLTGHGTLDSAKMSLKRGAFDYLSKPCDIDLLASKINDAYEFGKGGFKEKEEKKASDIMIPLEEYTSISADSTVKDAIGALKRSYESFLSSGKVMEYGHRSILVFDTRGRLSGILSILDLIKALRPAYLTAPKPSMADALRYSTMFWSGLFTSQAKGLVNKKVSDIMSEPPLTIEEDANLMEIAEMMVTEKARRVAVTRKGKVIGVVREQELFFEIARIVSGSES